MVVDTVVDTVVCVPGLAVAGATVTNTQKHYCYQHTETLLLPAHRNTTVTNTQKHYCYQHTETLLLPTHRNTIVTST